MKFKEYQELALKTWEGPKKQQRAVFALVSEVGEVIGKAEKNWRTDYDGDPSKFFEAISKEIGDVLYYTAVLAYELNYTDLDNVVLKKESYEPKDFENVTLYSLVQESYLILDNWINELEIYLDDFYAYLLDLCNIYDLDIEEIANKNIAKLADRAARNVIKGSGDNR